MLLYWYTYGSQVKAEPSSGHGFHARSCVKRDYPSEIREIVSYYTHASQVGVGEIPSHHQVMSDDIDNIQDPRHYMSRRTFFLTYAWVCTGLDGSTCSECLSVVTCDFEPPEHKSRTSARGRTCAFVFGRAPFVPRSREHEKRPAVGREKIAHPQEKHIYLYTVI